MQKLAVFHLALALALTISATSPADTRRVPARHAERPLVLPSGTLRIDGGPRWPFPTGLLVDTVVNDAEDRFFVNLGASAGIVRDLELGAVVPVRVSPDLDALDPIVDGTYRLTHGKAQVGVFAAIPIPVENDFFVLGGVPLIVRLGRSVRFDTGGFLAADFGDRTDAIFPLLVAVNVDERVFLGPEAGLVFDDLDRGRVPLGFFIGDAIALGGEMLGDVTLRARVPDVDRGLDVFQILLAFDLYFDL